LRLSIAVPSKGSALLRHGSRADLGIFDLGAGWTVGMGAVKSGSELLQSYAERELGNLYEASLLLIAADRYPKQYLVGQREEEN
jgi:hypothetical protein